MIDVETWTALRDQLATKARDHSRNAHATEPSLLAGVLVDARGERLTASHAVKKGRRYRYYVSAALITEAGTDRPQGWRLAAQEIEDAVIRVLADALTRPAMLLERFDTAGIPGDQTSRMLDRATRFAAALKRSAAERATVVRDLIEKVVIEEDAIMIRVRRSPLLGGAVMPPLSENPSDSPIELTTPVAFRRRGVEMRLVLPAVASQNDRSKCDPTLIKAIARGRAWFEELAAGRARSLRELAERDGITRRYVRRLVDLASVQSSGRSSSTRRVTVSSTGCRPWRIASTSSGLRISAASWRTEERPSTQWVQAKAWLFSLSAVISRGGLHQCRSEKSS